MAYATTPVLGATNWTAPNWIGLPVQWCGTVYSYALLMLAPYDGKATIQSQSGSTYQVLVDGKRIIDIKSIGEDIVDFNEH